MVGRGAFALATGLALIALPGTAGAATVGSISTTGAVSCGSGPAAAVQLSVATGPSYRIPSQSVITGWRTTNGATSTSGMLLVARLVGGTATIVGATPVTLTPTVNQITTVSGVQIPVQANDVLGIGLTAATAVWPCQRNTISAGDHADGGIPTGFTPGSTFSTAATVPTTLLNVEATIEPDADGDGFGDTTQDSCPTIVTIHAGPCVMDLSLKKVALDKTVAVGDLAAFNLTVHNASAGAAPGATLTDKLPAGVKPLLAVSSSGVCILGTTVACTLGPIAAGKDVTVTILATGKKAGVWKNTATVAVTGATDPNAANNKASATFTVGDCSVPDLVGKTVAGAKKALKKAGCKLGRKRGKGKQVVKQSPQAGTHKKLGAKVSVTLGTGRVVNARAG